MMHNEAEFYREIEYSIPCMIGEDVKKAQIVLKDLGFLNCKVDGIFGPETEEAIVEYQRKYNLLNQDGIIDKETWDSIMENKKN